MADRNRPHAKAGQGGRANAKHDRRTVNGMHSDLMQRNTIPGAAPENTGEHRHGPRRGRLLPFLPPLLLALGGCSPDTVPEPDSHAFVLSDTMLSRIQLDTVRESPVRNVINLNGRIAADGNRTASVFAIMSGQVESVDVELGDRVEKGQVLAKIRSSDVAKLERKLIDARSDKEVAEKNLATKEDLYNSQLLSERKLVEARFDLEKANAQLQRMNEIFSIYTIEAGSRYVLRAPVSGYVIAKAIARDVTLPEDDHDPVFTIAELDNVWVLADVYESDIARVKEGMEAEVSTLSYPDRVFRGRVDKIFNILDPRTRTMRIRISLGNPEVLLKPEMIARVRLAFQEGRALPTIPARAVITENGKSYVMAFRDRYNISTREITPFRTTGDTTWTANGLQPGEVVIGKEQLYIYDALNDE